METKNKRPVVNRKPASRNRSGSAGAAGHKGSTGVQVKRPKRTATGRVRNTQKRPSEDVVYVQPAPFNRTRFVLCLLIVLAVVIAVIFGMSIFFKVDADKISVAGAEKYTPWQIREASGIHDGDNLLSVNEPRISSNIKAALPYVNKVRVGIKLPDTVKIEIEELDVVYSVQDKDGAWWLIRSDGGIVEKTNSADAEIRTKLLGVCLADPTQGQEAVAYQGVRQDETGETIPVTISAAEQLSTALSIAQFLEDCGIIGQAESIDVTDVGDLQLWYGEQYQVMLGNAMELPRKIKSVKAAIDQMGDYQSGVLDVSFTTWPNEVGYTPFS